MKNKLRILTIGALATIVFPTITKAAGLSLELNGELTNKAIYNVKYDSIDSTNTEGTLNFKVYSNNDNVTMKLSKSYGGGECTNTSCSLTGITTDGTVATIELTNDKANPQDVTLELSGDYTATKQFTLNAGETTTTTTQARVLSSDATLSGISVSIGTMDQAFTKEITTYNISGIKDTINSLTITPTCDNNCTWSLACPTGECSITNLKKVTLNEGANQVAINVESEDGKSKKTYTLNVYRGEIKANSAYLTSLKIKGTALSPAFDSLTNDYTAKVGLSVEKLDITTIAEDPNATIVVKGGDKLVEGENTVTVTVTASDLETKQVYTVIVTKEKLASDEKDDKNKVTTTKVAKKKDNTWLIILLSVLGLTIIIVAFILIFKKKKNKNNKSNNDKNDKSNNGKTEEVQEKQNDKNDKLIESTNDINLIDEELEHETVSYAKTQSLDELQKEMRELMDEEPKQDVDEALDDLMKTKKLELGDLDF